MPVDDDAQCPRVHAAPQLATHLQQHLTDFLTPLLQHLDAQLDARLVRTFHATIMAMLVLRHRSYGLLVSERGGYLLHPHQAPAGTKRLSNLLRSSMWSATIMRQFLWQQAQRREQATAILSQELPLIRRGSYAAPTH